jgi:hypothetical protein
METSTQTKRPSKPGNVYVLTEWAEAFGDLGTLVPFVVAYVSVMKLEPLGVLFAFGATKIEDRHRAFLPDTCPGPADEGHRRHRHRPSRGHNPGNALNPLESGRLIAKKGDRK